KLQGAVSDGNTIGHPCCAIHNCKVPLARIGWDIYCPIHVGCESKCVMTVCHSPHEENYLTCVKPSHHILELAYHEKGTTF
ncbi:hypothetical protein K439DRAFT_1338970, partial [Ramaria rubella]